ncbi:MAG: ornithine cyclodeaminase family protein [SAR324 cluster bacterium]|nr:ornithine cyclodeaminase family protein [SAR324 cluster bacterium]
MLVLNEQDITRAVLITQLVDIMGQAFITYENGDFLMPDRMHVHDDKNTLLLMPCFAKEIFGTKLVSVFPGNSERNLPVIQGIVVLNNRQTGEPVAILNGPKLTAMRTAAVGSVAIRHLAPANVETLGIIGIGAQGFHQALFACSQIPIQRVLIFNRHSESMKRFKDKLAPLVPAVKIAMANTVRSLVEKSQVIITATSSNEPVLPDDEQLFSEKCFIGVGSFKPGMREFSEALFKNMSQVFVDTEFAIKECGDLAIPLRKDWIKREQVHTLAKLITGKVKRNPSPTTCFKSVGMALFDLFAAEYIYKQAIDKGLGTRIDI